MPHATSLTEKPARRFLVAVVLGSERYPASTKRYGTRAEANEALRRHAKRRPGLVFSVVSQKAA